mgnify:CR=1 FL=1
MKPPESESEAKLWKTMESIRESLAIDPAAMAVKLEEAGLDDDDVPLSTWLSSASTGSSPPRRS